MQELARLHKRIDGFLQSSSETMTREQRLARVEAMTAEDRAALEARFEKARAEYLAFHQRDVIGGRIEQFTRKIDRLRKEKFEDNARILMLNREIEGLQCRIQDGDDGVVRCTKERDELQQAFDNLPKCDTDFMGALKRMGLLEIELGRM